MAKKGLLRGSKFSMTHSTVIEAAEQFLMEAKKLDSVSKISVGIIKPCASGPRSIKLVLEQHAIRAQVGVHCLVANRPVQRDVPAPPDRS
jgi:hypothetical protein